MRYSFCFTLLFFICFNCAETTKTSENENTTTNDFKTNTETKAEFAIIIHGGAGTILKKNMTPEKEAAYKAKLEEAIRVGYEILKQGGSSIDAVQLAINVMEDSPLFNAGKGAVYTNAETNELDASIMDGKTLNAGASAGTTTVRNPINLARIIMDKSPHVMMAGVGAETYAKEQNLAIVEPSYFYTENRLNSVKRAKEREKIELDHDDKTAFFDAEIQNYKFGTVGCAALDKDGNLAAGTSTGGMTNKRYGRVGDAPIIGAGTYANNNSCAVSSTGWGEYFIRAMVAHDISALMQYKGLSLKEAAQEVIQKKVPELGGDGGIVAVDKHGNMVAEFNTSGMYRASMNAKGELTIGIYKE
ncbi:isoaspartyl peptidase/L-asparaginase family protein [Psychroserpens sp. SPM9]|uniref:isoaspartyl peptidase/L-asparaginase family protein n=1 Tax=Psychroserpens sp. SPM9 TaxID=2975598 RepID=UPI0021A8C64A|nr:isoaspartyl peptidase/L-asparaginase [Psychroserpens sp. SPM9]MDG5490901.1 isoaspartyl peptidase/L-asparaginase [Psychroserpens sp. SPM9]